MIQLAGLLVTIVVVIILTQSALGKLRTETPRHSHRSAHKMDPTGPNDDVPQVNVSLTPEMIEAARGDVDGFLKQHTGMSKPNLNGCQRYRHSPVQINSKIQIFTSH